MASYNVADLFAKFGVKTDAGSFRNALQSLSGLRDGLALVSQAARAVSETFKSFTTDVYEKADALDDLAAKTGVSVATLQELGYVGQFTETSMESLATGMKILQRNMVGSVEGSKELQASFKALKINLVDSTGHLRGTEDVLMDVIDRFADMPAGAKKTQLMMQLLGKSGGELTGIFNLGSDGIKEYVQEFRQLGGELGEDTIKNSAKLEDNFIRLKTAMQGVKNTVAEALLPVFNDLTSDTLEWVKANQDLIRTKVREYVLAAVDAIKSFVAQVRTWIEEQGGLGKVIEKAGMYLKAFAVIIAGIKIAEFISSISSMIQVMKVLGMTIKTGLGFAGLAGVIIWTAQQIIENWDDVRAFGLEIFWAIQRIWMTLSDFFVEFGRNLYSIFVQPWIDAGTEIKDFFAAVFDWIVGKVVWVADKVGSVLDYINPFNIDDNSTSGTRGVQDDTLSPAAAAILQNRGRYNKGLGMALEDPSLAPSGGGGNVQVTNSPQITVYQQPGEDGDKFAKRVVAINQEEQQRSLREAQGGIL